MLELTAARLVRRPRLRLRRALDRCREARLRAGRRATTRTAQSVAATARNARDNAVELAPRRALRPALPAGAARADTRRREPDAPAAAARAESARDQASEADRVRAARPRGRRGRGRVRSARGDQARVACAAGRRCCSGRRAACAQLSRERERRRARDAADASRSGWCGSRTRRVMTVSTWPPAAAPAADRQHDACPAPGADPDLPPRTAMAAAHAAEPAPGVARVRARTWRPNGRRRVDRARRRRCRWPSGTGSGSGSTVHQPQRLAVRRVPVVVVVVVEEETLLAAERASARRSGSTWCPPRRRRSACRRRRAAPLAGARRACGRSRGGPCSSRRSRRRRRGRRPRACRRGC